MRLMNTQGLVRFLNRMGFCVLSLFCGVVLSDLSNFTIILSRTFIEDLTWIPHDVNLVLITLQSKMVCTVVVTYNRIYNRWHFLLAG